MVHTHKTNAKVVETGRSQELAGLMIWGQVNDPVSKIQDEGTKGMQLRLTPSLYMPGFICAEVPTHMNTLTESVRFPQALQRQILKADTWCT